MVPAIVKRAIVKRNEVENWGKNIQTWIQERPPVSVFVLAVILAFLLSLVTLACIWETIRKCRSSYRSASDREHQEWIRLPDGSSVLTQGRVPATRETRTGSYSPGALVGPMHSFIRDARQGGANQQPRNPYVPAQTGGVNEMATNTQLRSESYTLYDPPLAAQPNFQRQSTASTSEWSDQTRADQMPVETKELNSVTPVTLPRAQPTPPIASILIPSIAPPPRPSPAPSSSSVPTVGTPASPPGPTASPLARPIGAGHTRQASSGAFQPKGLTLLNNTPNSGGPQVVGEDRFSSPKPTPTPSSTLNSVRSSISSGGWSAPTLTPSPAPTDKTFISSTSIFAPRVDLKRSGTWSSSLSSWIPGLSGGGNDKLRDNEEEETRKLVDDALKNAR